MGKARYKILLIEDDRLDQKAFMRLVKEKELPYDCTQADSVSQAQSILESERFDVLVCDYSLGDGTALDILDLVKDTPVIIVTGAGDEEVAVKAWKAGAYDYLIKDLERNYLKTVPITIENAVGHKETKERAQLLSAAIMSTDDSVYITDMDDKIIFVNRAFCETYGYEEQEVIGEDSNILYRGISPKTDSRNIFQAFSGREVGSYHTRKDGSEFPVSLSRSIIKDGNGNEIALVGVARDVGERILIEDKIRTINQKLSQGNRPTNCLS